MRILIDTNVFIPLEPSSIEDLEPTTPAASRFLRLASDEEIQILVHPDSLIDIGRDRNESRKELRRTLFAKYQQLKSPPGNSPELDAVVGDAAPLSNDWVDHRLLAAVQSDAVSYLVTEDEKLRRKAERLGIGDRVLTLRDAVALIESLTEQKPRRLPNVVKEPVYSVVGSDPIFQSLRSDYHDFDQWMSKAKREGREALIIRGSGGECAAICILKPGDDEFGQGGRSLKLSTFKVSDDHIGNRYGELLLKAIFDYSYRNRFDLIWVSVFDRHAELIALLEHFGFFDSLKRTSRGEVVMMKSCETDTHEMVPDPFEYHRLHGPPSVCLGQPFDLLVPIQPRYHRVLFPELDEQVQLWRTGQQQLGFLSAVSAPFGNALRKAYLSNSPIRSLAPGRLLYFYRSGDLRAVTTVGVVEDSRVSTSADDVERFVGGRSVYSLSEIRQLATKPVLSILFRQDRHLKLPIRIEELMANEAVSSAPQSISRVRSEGAEWIRRQVQTRH